MSLLPGKRFNIVQGFNTRMTGYHYTTLKNWKKIKKEGLLPHEFAPWILESIGAYGGHLRQGVWLWKEKPKGESHIGNIIYQLAKGEDTSIVLLSVRYAQKDLYTVMGAIVNLIHRGVIGEWNYHTEDKAVIIPFGIPPNRVRLLKTYKVNSLLK